MTIRDLIKMGANLDDDLIVTGYSIDEEGRCIENDVTMEIAAIDVNQDNFIKITVEFVQNDY